MSEKPFYILNCRDPFPKVPVANDGDFKVNDEGYVVVYTDGSCLHNGQPYAKAGIGVFFGDSHPLNISKPLEKGQPPTNNVAEIFAVIEAIKTVKTYGVRQVAIYLDSNYIIQCLRDWIPKWKKNNWIGSKGTKVAHEAQYKKMLSIMENMNVMLKFVKGHDGHYGNEEAHNLAQNGAAQFCSLYQ